MNAGFIRRLLTLGYVLAVLLLPAGVYAQEATIAGTVSDSSGGVLPGVTVTAVSESTGFTLEAVTDERGMFRMPARIGNYRVTAVPGGLLGCDARRRAGVGRSDRNGQPAVGSVRVAGIGHGHR